MPPPKKRQHRRLRKAQHCGKERASPPPLRPKPAGSISWKTKPPSPPTDNATLILAGGAETEGGTVKSGGAGGMSERCEREYHTSFHLISSLDTGIYQLYPKGDLRLRALKCVPLVSTPLLSPPTLASPRLHVHRCTRTGTVERARYLRAATRTPVYLSCPLSLAYGQGAEPSVPR
ncbi:hypothetical protein B0H16DRAFT_1727178 [Mycena metata]|uniref:Uncharacterized protein n=1 Tax=Mycena metata TaxID=1033252 RepID=A0AAD7IK01_9AGAR|nr:hypothetical protein B0H16DRAFT_1727178 [Mycena metata]